MRGTLETIVGAMFAGKTSELLKRILWAKHQNKKIIVIKPTIDDRYANKKIITQQVGAVDIFPTILNILELESNSKFDGVSLLPLINGRVFPENPIYIHTMPHQKVSENDCVGIRTSKYKYFRHARIPTQNIHLFDLVNDVFENDNINDKFPDIVKNFETILSDFPESDFCVIVV